MMQFFLLNHAVKLMARIMLCYFALAHLMNARA